MNIVDVLFFHLFLRVQKRRAVYYLGSCRPPEPPSTPLKRVLFVRLESNHLTQLKSKTMLPPIPTVKPTPFRKPSVQAGVQVGKAS
jgi:hypothetical protein